MKYNNLGKTDLKVSVICLGTMTWGEQNTQDEAFEQLDYALDHEVNFIDTAEMYPVPGRAETYASTERIIGNYIAARGQNTRDKMILATKVCGPNAGITYARDGELPRLDRKNITYAVHASLKRLQTDYIDLYQLHWPDRNAPRFASFYYQHDENEDMTPLEETLGALNDLVKEGLVRHVGLSNETPWGTMEYLRLSQDNGWVRPVSVQNVYHLLNRVYETGMSEVSMREDIGLLAYSPLAFGVLTGKYLTDMPEGSRMARFPVFRRYLEGAGKEATAAYVALAREHDLDPGQMALAYVNTRPFVTSNIIGATSVTQLQTNIASANITLSPEVIEGIETLGKQYFNPALN